MFKYLKKYLILGIIAALFMVGEVSMDLLQPALMSTIVDDGVLGLSTNNVGDLNLIITTGVKMIGTVALGGLCGILCGVFTNLCSHNFANAVRKDTFKKILSLSFQQTGKFTTGSLITRVTNDVTQLQHLVGMCFRGFIRSMIQFVGGIFCMLSLNMSFGMVAIIAFPILVVCVLLIITRVSPKFAVLQNKLDKLNNVLQENITGMRVVKAFVKEKHEKKRFGDANEELVGTQLNILTIFSFMGPIMNIVLNLAVVAVIYIGGIQVQAGAATPGNVMAAITYLSQVLGSAMMIAMMFQMVSRGMASYRRIKEVLSCEPAVADGNGAEEKEEQKKGRIEFKNVSFAYPESSGEYVLKDINLTIEPGETIGFLGATGSGKSTLVNLVPRFYDVTEGELLVDGINVKTYQLKALRNKIAIALQKSELFSASIKENILWGKPGASDEEVRKAAEEAQAMEFISAQPEGLDSLVAEKGMSLSGGQKQRLSISRAVIKEAEILIFDDATSALDLKTEANLYKALRENYGDVTKLIIAQRIASVKGADRIVVLDNGGISAVGTHEQLMENSEIYRDIYMSQLKGGADNE
ncbi:MAG: ABC transporter ATP-binding protein [Ruminococcaceae bacterium]|nr:ABC transporter ATP-binding protein [Oscillospiraceae bacterium]